MKNIFYFGIGLLLLVLAVGNALMSNVDISQFLMKINEDTPALMSSAPDLTDITQSARNQLNSLYLSNEPTKESFTQIPKVDETETEKGFVPIQIEKNTRHQELKSDLQQIDPARLIIKSIELDALIIPALKKEIKLQKKTYDQWSAPNLYAVGWQYDSAGLGAKGNTVLNGHHNVFGKVFENLNLVKVGDRIQIDGVDGSSFFYVVNNVMILPERDVDLDQRLNNAKWILPSADERITLVTCWPYYSNTHRLIVVAIPIIEKNLELIQ